MGGLNKGLELASAAAEPVSDTQKGQEPALAVTAPGKAKTLTPEAPMPLQAAAMTAPASAGLHAAQHAGMAAPVTLSQQIH